MIGVLFSPFVVYGLLSFNNKYTVRIITAHFNCDVIDREIQTHYQYLGSGIRDVNLKLDNEWDAYQLAKNGSK